MEASGGIQRIPGYYFKPDNVQDLQRYCRDVTTYIEYHAVIEVLRMDDIDKTIAKYDTAEAWVKALNAKYLKDKDYIYRILPAYQNVNIHCIIVVHSPDGTRFFLEDGNSHNSFLEIPESEFLSSLYKASDQDITNFWLGLH